MSIQPTEPVGGVVVTFGEWLETRIGDDGMLGDLAADRRRR